MTALVAWRPDQLARGLLGHLRSQAMKIGVGSVRWRSLLLRCDEFQYRIYPALYSIRSPLDRSVTNASWPRASYSQATLRLHLPPPSPQLPRPSTTLLIYIEYLTYYPLFSANN